MPDGQDNYETPITDEVYCYTSRCGGRYYTLFAGPLLEHFLHPQPMIMKMQLCSRTFVAQTDKPMLLIPYDHPMALKYALDKTTYGLDPSPEDLAEGSLQEVTIPMEFDPGVHPYFQFRIGLDGKLFKKERDTWKKYDLKK